MSVITLTRQHDLPLDELKHRLEKVAEKIETRLSVHCEWESDRNLIFRRKGASGFLTYDENQLDLTVKLGMMFRALKIPIEKEITAAVDKYLQ